MGNHKVNKIQNDCLLSYHAFTVKTDYLKQGNHQDTYGYCDGETRVSWASSSESAHNDGCLASLAVKMRVTNKNGLIMECPEIPTGPAHTDSVYSQTYIHKIMTWRRWFLCCYFAHFYISAEMVNKPNYFYSVNEKLGNQQHRFVYGMLWF